MGRATRRRDRKYGTEEEGDGEKGERAAEMPRITFQPDDP
jgi:hypothetical protein